MTQEERWLARYNEVKNFIETNHRNPSKYYQGQGTGTCPNLKNQRFAYLFPHPVLSWEGL